MDTILVIRDSVACCVRKTAEICQPCVKEAETNCLDVAIVFIICVAIALVAIYAIRRYFKWKDDERKALETAADNKRKYEMEDRKLKQKADLEDKLLSHLKDGAEIKRDEDGNEIAKFNPEASKEYTKVLNQMINGGGSQTSTAP